jgi:predicted RNA-binding Zn-ribbon protein involved in translation (DUF1610 family)
MNERLQWIKAGELLIQNKYAQVLCPSCGLAFLRVEDELLGETHVERHISCPNCGAHESILKRSSADK